MTSFKTHPANASCCVPARKPRSKAGAAPCCASEGEGEAVVVECKPAGRVRPKATKGYVKVFKALGDTTRLEILGLLSAARAELCVCDVESHFKLSQPTVSHHLKLLREAGLIVGERRGNWIYYRIDPKTLMQLVQFKDLLNK